MVDEQEPAKRVVKRVVKKTVVRPAASTPEQSKAPAPAPTMRYGRPVATASRPTASTTERPASATAKATVEPGPTRSPDARPATPTRPKRQAPSIDLRAKAADVRDLAGRAWWAVADRVVDGSRATGTFVVDQAHRAAGYRLPHLSPYPAAAITGAVVGVLSVLLGIASLSLFETVRGVASGGGLWGGIAFTAIAVVAAFVGEALLRGFGTQAARLKSFLAVVLAIIAMLGLFLEVADGVIGLVLLPVLGVAAYALSHWLVDLAENAPVTD